jgi:hypothetical protein
MSTKTIKQRIALVAVSALTAGLISVVSTPAANAGVGSATVAALNQLATSNTSNPKLTHHDRLFIATWASTTGSGVALTAQNIAPEADSTTVAPVTDSAKSLGLINVSDIAANTTPTAGTTQTAVLLSTGRLSVYTSTAANSYSAITVTGGTIASSTGKLMNSNSTVASGGSASIENWGVVLAPSSGATTMIVRLYTGTGITSAAVGRDTPTLGTLTGQITVTIAAASTAGVVSPVTSGVFGAATSTDQSNDADDSLYVGQAQYSTAMYLNVRVRDGFGTAITSSSNGVLSVTATNGALVGVHASTAPAGTQSSAFLATTSPDDDMISVAAPGTSPVLTTVTVSWNGTVIGTKTLLFTGEVAKVTLSSPAIGKTSNTTGNYAYYMLTDSAGNKLYPSFLGASQTAYAESALLNDTAVAAGSTPTGLAKERVLSLSAALVETTGRVQFVCNSTAGNGTIGLTYTNPSGSIVKSNALTVKCAGDAYTYSASWDKASYIPGDIAKLTVTFRDSKGNLAQEASTPVTNSTTAKAPSVNIGGLDKTVVGPASNDSIEQGVKVYTYTVGATEGTYAGTVVFPLVDDRQIAVAGSAAAVTTTLVVKAATATVSNADVLKSIVALIASINKQIQALQKLILRR